MIMKERYYPCLFVKSDYNGGVDKLYDEGSDHIFGIYIASRAVGFMYEDDISKFINPVSQSAIQQYEKHCKPLLNKMEIIKSIPSVHIIYCYL